MARNDWGFDGYITSDCDAVGDVFNKHHYYATEEETVAGVMAAGTDIDCTSFLGAHAQSALDKKLITEDDIDAHLKTLFKVCSHISVLCSPQSDFNLHHCVLVCTGPHASGTL